MWAWRGADWTPCITAHAIGIETGNAVASTPTAPATAVSALPEEVSLAETCARSITTLAFARGRGYDGSRISLRAGSGGASNEP